MKVLGIAGNGRYLVEVDHQEIEKALGKYYGKLTTLRVGESVNLGEAYDYSTAIERVCGDMIEAGEKLISAYLAERGKEAAKHQEWSLDQDTAKFLADMITAGDEPAEITLRVGFLQDDDGSVKHGLLVYESDYPEEGASILAESPAPVPQQPAIPEGMALVGYTTPDVIINLRNGTRYGGARISPRPDVDDGLTEPMFAAAGVKP